MQKVIHWSYLGERAIEIASLSDEPNFYVGLSDFLKRKLILEIEDIYITDHSITVQFKFALSLPVDDLIVLVEGYDHQDDVISNQPVISIPICYYSEFMMDAQHLQKQLNLDFDSLIELHLAGSYRVAMFGFMPGFPYLSGLNDLLSVPRLATPRKRVPKGAVAISNNMCGIYPNTSPGGWNIIGRSPFKLFDECDDPPVRLKLGQAVQFCRISKSEYDAYLGD